jgi:hypothetical protein
LQQTIQARSSPLPQPLPEQTTQSQSLKFISQDDKIRDLWNNSCSQSNFAVKLMEYFFSIQELIDPKVNVSGRTMNGGENSMIILDEIRLKKIKQIVLEKVAGDDTIKKFAWSQATKAMSKKMSFLKSAAKKFQNN